MPTALITGGSRGLGRALAEGLAHEGWRLIVDARTGHELDAAAKELSALGQVVAIGGDVNDPTHRDRLAVAAGEAGGLDLLVNNASALGPSPLQRLDEVHPDVFHRVLATNVVAPLALYQAVSGHLVEGAVVMNISSDAAVEAYAGWGVYGASKAALDQVSAILAAERPDLSVYAIDPGDMRTRMHQEAFPGEDISDRPLPEEVAPALLAVVFRRPPSGRIVAANFAPAAP